LFVPVSIATRHQTIGRDRYRCGLVVNNELLSSDHYAILHLFPPGQLP
jgi:hypothetical protein